MNWHAANRQAQLGGGVGSGVEGKRAAGWRRAVSRVGDADATPTQITFSLIDGVKRTADTPPRSRVDTAEHASRPISL